MSDPVQPSKPRFGVMNLGFGLILLSAGAYRTWRSAEAARDGGGDAVQVFWLSIIIGSVLTIAGAIQLIMKKS